MPGCGPPRRARGKHDLATAIKASIGYVGAGRAGGAIAQAKLQLVQEQERRVRLENDAAEGALLPLATVQAVMDETAATFRAHLDALPGRAGVDLRLAWAESATELASQPAGLALIDERDRMANDVRGESDPLELVEARGDTYPDAVIGVFSTPTIGSVDVETDPETGLTRWQPADPADIESPTWRLWQAGT